MAPESGAPADGGAPQPQLRRTYRRGRVRSAGEGALVVELPDWPGHVPGQFAMLSLDPTGTSFDPLLPRPMAVFRGDASGLEFRFKVVGRGTARMAQLQTGDPVGVLGPLGRGFPVLDGPAVLVGGGTGIASLYELAAGSPKVRVRLGARTRAELLAMDDFRALGVPLEVATEDGSEGHAGRVTEALEIARDEVVCACGPTPMMRAVHEMAHRAGARCLVSLESPMACGIGVCLGCAVPTSEGFRYVCTHGPVFEADALDWGGVP